MNDVHSLSHSKWNCKYHIVFAPKYRNRSFWCRGYYVDTVEKNTQKIKDYIAKQLEEDRMTNQMTFDDIDPFNG